MKAVVKNLNPEFNQSFEAKKAVEKLLEFIGEDPERNGLLDTPKRVVESYAEIFSGYHESPEKVLSKTFEDVGGYKDFVLLKDIEFYSMCEHHMLPFFGKVHIAYIPNNKIVGISKLVRVVEIFSRRLQVQEKMTSQIASAINEFLQPKGVIVNVTAKHFCMSMRGVKNSEAVMSTCHYIGDFVGNESLINRFESSVK
jgi:GTP cyclohydrolase I